MVHMFLNTPDAVGDAVRTERARRHWTQTYLAKQAHVGRRFVVDVESGHPRAELGKVLAVLEALEIHATALPSVATPKRREDVDLKAAVRRFGG